jgi:NAD(P) transhydrogenase subunit alpha
MLVGVPKENYPSERRVALVPSVLPLLASVGLEVGIEQGAGISAGFPDLAYIEHGARIFPDRSKLFSSSQILLRVRNPAKNVKAAVSTDTDSFNSNQLLIGLLDPLGSPEMVANLASQAITSFALELLPRISRAQSMDALTAMATVAGYKSVLLAANISPKMYPMMITAAGTIAPVRVLVVGAGVAGLQAIATARRLGAVVYSYDVRPAVKEQVESLGARFLELDLETDEAEAADGYARAMDAQFYNRQAELMAEAMAESDVVITTAAVPGSKAPVLITEEAVRGMQPGSVIIDLAAETGGNCEVTLPGERVEVHGVTVVGPVNLPSTVPYHASQMLAKNLTAFLQNLVVEGAVRLDTNDPVIGESLLTHQGEVVNSRVRNILGLDTLTSVSDEGSKS